MSESDTKTGKEENPNITEATVEQPPQQPTAKITDKAQPKTPEPKQKAQPANRVVEAVKKTVTYINEFGKEFEATPTESFPIGTAQGKDLKDCSPNQIIHHLEYIENGIKKVVRSVHHINTRPTMADGSSICVWK